jgi:hypothetical protein
MPFKTAFTFWLTFSGPEISAFLPLLHFRSTNKRQSNDSLLLVWRRDNSNKKQQRNNPRKYDNDVDRNYEWWKSQERFSPENLQGKFHKNAEKEHQWRQDEWGMHHESPSEWNQQEPFIADAEFYDVPSIPMEETIIEEEDLPYLENAFEQTRDTVIYEEQMNVERPYEQVDALPWNENKVKRYNQAPIQPLEQQRSYMTRTSSSRRRPSSRKHASSLLRRVDLSLRQQGKREREARQYHRTLRLTQLLRKQTSQIPIYQKIATIQSGLVGAFVGTLTMAPIAGLHHFVLFPSYYSSTAQWEWDTGTALVQGGLFAILYRFLIARGDNGVQAMQTVILSTVCVIRTVVRVQVPMYCTALPLQCGESTSFFMDWDILGQLSIHFVESVYLFYTVAATMDWLLQNEWILPYESID